jgi:hypothetical protein
MASEVHFERIHWAATKQASFSYYMDPHSQDEGDAGNQTHP